MANPLRGKLDRVAYPALTSGRPIGEQVPSRLVVRQEALKFVSGQTRGQISFCRIHDGAKPGRGLRQQLVGSKAVDHSHRMVSGRRRL